MTISQSIDHPQQVCSQSPDTDAPVVHQQATKPVGSVCPRCGGFKLRKNGTKSGRQRFRCTACGKTWGPSLGHPSYRSKRSQSTWQEFMRGVETRTPLRELAKNCCISMHTACRWRQKYLAAHAQMVNEFLDGMEARGMVKDGRVLDGVRKTITSEIDRLYRGRSLQKAKERFWKWQMRFLEKLQRKQARESLMENNPFLQNPMLNPMAYTDPGSTLPFKCP